MTPTLCHSREQAWLCMLVAAASAEIQRSGGYASRTALMLGCCCAKLLGTRLTHEFEIFPSGPFSPAVLIDLALLEQDGALRNRSLSERDHADYVCGGAAPALLARHGLWLKEERSKADRIVRALAPLTREHLAMVTHVHFAWLWWTGQPELVGELREQVIREVGAAALPGATEAQLQRSYEELLKLGLLGRPVELAVPDGIPAEQSDQKPDNEQ